MAEDRKTLLSGHEVVAMEGQELQEFNKHWKGYHSRGMVRIMPGACLLPKHFTTLHDRIWNFELTSSDVVVVTYPKCGTTWTQEIVWTLRNNPALDHPMAPAPVNVRAPFLEFDMLINTDAVPEAPPNSPLMTMFQEMVPNGDPSGKIFLQMAEHLPHPRTIKSHLPFSLLPSDLLDKCKVVYVMRNPKDVVVSYEHHCRIMKVQDFTGDQDEFVKEFTNGDLLYGHYDTHLKEAFERKNHPNLHILSFEDLKANPMDEYTKLDKFLDTKRTKEQIEKIVEYTSFSEMKKRDTIVGSGENPMFNMDIVREDGGFFRKGEAGNWKKKLSPDNSAKVDTWAREKLGHLAKEMNYE